MTSASLPRAPMRPGILGAFRAWWGNHALAQVCVIAAIFVVAGLLGANVLDSMRRLGMAPNLSYLWQPANFDIAESLIPYRAGDIYAQAILVGLLNTAKLAFFGCVLATLLGVALGVARLLGNPLVSRLVQAYVEVVRNTPLMLQLFFWISLTHALPPVRQALRPLPDTYLSIRGVFLPWVQVENGGNLGWWLFVVLVVYMLATRLATRWRGRPLSPLEFLGWLATFVVLAGLWCALAGVTISVDTPKLNGFNIVGGVSLTPEFAAMLVGLTIYYAASISESVRSGIQSVSTGQWEAGRALGLVPGRIVWLIVLPQAMRVITPLMTSSYLDLTKDTTLGILIGFTEVTAVIKTSANNTGNAVETIIVLVAIFLSISLPVSLLINFYNRRLIRRGVIAR